MGTRERRKNAPPVPKREKLPQILTPEQLHTLHRLENYGWQLKYVRRPLFQDPVLVLYNAQDGRHSLLEPDGTLLEMEDVDLRKETVDQ